MNCPIVALAQALIQHPSLSPFDAGCQLILQHRLQAVGFTVELLPFGDTLNLWAWHGKGVPCVTLVGHTDVVPVGDLQQWQYPPFAAQLSDGMLYGRGAADMKGALAALVIAAERFVMAHPKHLGRLALLITSDEEGRGSDGTVKVVAELLRRKEKIHYCLVGEPSSHIQLGDVIKNGRRGSLTGSLSVHGVQGHVAYPQAADNPIHGALPALQQLLMTEWDSGNTSFPPTCLQIVHLQAGVGANNVIPGLLQAVFNFRYTPELDGATLKARVCAVLEHHGLNYTLTWHHTAQPFLTSEGRLVNTVRAAVKRHTGLTPVLSTAGGTSDGRFIASMGAEVVELGPLNATIHQVNECVRVADLTQLGVIYQQIISDLLQSEVRNQSLIWLLVIGGIVRVNGMT